MSRRAALFWLAWCVAFMAASTALFAAEHSLFQLVCALSDAWLAAYFARLAWSDR